MRVAAAAFSDCRDLDEEQATQDPSFALTSAATAAAAAPATASATGGAKAASAGSCEWRVEVSSAAGPEATRRGKVAWRVWRLYARSAGLPMVLLLLLACAVRCS